MNANVYRSGMITISMLALAVVLIGCNAENGTGSGGPFTSGGGSGTEGVAGGDPNIPGGGGYSGGAGVGGGGAGVGGGGAGVGGGGAGAGTAGQPVAGETAPGEWVEIDTGSGDACAAFSSAAQQVEITTEVEVPYEVVEYEPVAIYIMLDQSASMIIPELSLQPRWWVAYDAINAFVNDPLSADIGVALQYFPLQNAPCDGSVYDTPDVPMGMLPGHANAILTSLNTHLPFNDMTPIEPALIGATRYCQQYKSDPVANPEGLDCAVVLITDGMPSQCSQDYTVISNVAGNAFNGNPSVYTFAVGMFGADFFLMNQIAQKGGTDCTPNDGIPDNYACDVSTGATTLLQALELIRDFITTMEIRTEYRTEYQTVALECEWKIPPPPEGEHFDRNKVNVEFSPTGSEADKQIIAMVETEADCTNELSWYYDDPNNPTRIIACPQTCEIIQAATTGTINILLGCQTVLLE
jgi:hypothetical protein